MISHPFPSSQSDKGSTCIGCSTLFVWMLNLCEEKSIEKHRVQWLQTKTLDFYLNVIYNNVYSYHIYIYIFFLGDAPPPTKSGKRRLLEIPCQKM